MPLRHCSSRYSIVGTFPQSFAGLEPVGSLPRRCKSGYDTFRKTRRQKHALLPSQSLPLPRRSVRHLALLPVLVLIVLDNRRDRLQAIFVAVLHRLLQIEILDRDVIGPELEISAHRFEVALLRSAAHGVLLGEIAVDGFHDAVE